MSKPLLTPWIITESKKLIMESASYETTNHSIDEKTLSAVKSWAREVDLALRHDYPYNFPDLDGRLKFLEEKGERLEAESKKNIEEAEDLDIAFAAFDKTCLEFEADPILHAANYEAIKREGSRLKETCQVVKERALRTLEEKEAYENEILELKEEVARFGEDLERLHMAKRVQSVPL